MDTQKWAVLLTAAEKGSLSQAAEELGYTQSGLTHMMNALEQEAGFPLLQRGKSGVRLTHDAASLLPRIRALLQSSDALQQEIDAIRGLESGTLRIGAYSSLVVSWLPQVLQRFERECPGVRLELFDYVTSIEGEWLSNGQVDMIFCSSDVAENWDWIPLLSDELVAVLPLSYAERQWRSLPLTAFNDLPYLEFSVELITKNALAAAGVNPKVKYSFNHGSAMIAMIEHGVGCGILPELMLSGQEQLLTLPLDPPIHRELGVVLPSLAQASPAAQRFIACAKAVIAGQAQGTKG